MPDNSMAAPTGLDNVRKDLPKAGHAPGYVYSSPEVYQREIDTYFMKDWLLVGRVEELPKVGDFMTMRITGEPIVIARDRDGNLNAYYNMCIHRGVEVAEGKGNTRAFKCPYHGWVYDLQGKLTGATHMKDSEGFDLSNCRMRPVRLEVWRGNMFVCFDAATPPLAEYLSDFERDFAFLGMEKCRLGNRITIELDCNWKYVPENLMDFYHVNVLHAKTFGAKFSWENDNVILGKNGYLTIWYNAAPPTPGGQPLLGKMPWLEDRDYSLACTGFLQPNLTVFGRIDCARFFVTWPLGPTKCQVIIYHLFPEEVFQRPDIEDTLKIYRDYQLAVLDEDRSMMESMQKAMSTRGYVPGRMSIMEKPLHHYLNGHLDRVFGDRGKAP